MILQEQSCQRQRVMPFVTETLTGEVLEPRHTITRREATKARSLTACLDRNLAATL